MNTIRSLTLMAGLAALVAAVPLFAFNGNGDAASTLNLGAPKKDGNVEVEVKLIGPDAKALTSFKVTVPIKATDTADAKALKILDSLRSGINTNEVAAQNISAGAVGNVVVVNSTSDRVRVIRVANMEDGTGQEMKITEKPDSGKPPAPPASTAPPAASAPRPHGVRFHLDRNPSGVPLEGPASIVRVGVNGNLYETTVQLGQTRLQVYQALALSIRLYGLEVQAWPDGLYVCGEFDEIDTRCLDAAANIGWSRF